MTSNANVGRGPKRHIMLSCTWVRNGDSCVIVKSIVRHDPQKFHGMRRRGHIGKVEPGVNLRVVD